MERKKLFKTLAFLVILLFVLNHIASKFYLYYSLWWIDMPMHFLGGICAGLFMVWLLPSENLFSELSWKYVFKIFLGVLLIGVLWEVFEIIFNNIIAQISFDARDTIHDISFDLSGGLYAILYIIWKKQQKKLFA
jgi:hypothetical protein